MKVLLVNGSPNKDGCTNAALQEIVGELQRQGVETEIFLAGTQGRQRLHRLQRLRRNGRMCDG